METFTTVATIPGTSQTISTERPPQAPAESQFSKRNMIITLELSDANFAEVFGVILMFLDQRFIPENLRFELLLHFT